MATTKQFCTCCERTLHPDREVWLELDQRSGKYARPGEVADDRSQGTFPFGKACAAKILANNGICEYQPRR